MRRLAYVVRGLRYYAFARAVRRARAFATAFLRVVVFAAAFFAVVLRAVVLRAVVAFFAATVLRAAETLRVAGFFAAVFFAVVLRAVVLRAPVATLRVVLRADVVFFAVVALRDVDFFTPRAAVDVFLRVVAAVEVFFAFATRLVDFGALVLLRTEVLRVVVFAFAEAVRFAVFGTATMCGRPFSTRCVDAPKGFGRRNYLRSITSHRLAQRFRAS